MALSIIFPEYTDEPRTAGILSPQCGFSSTEEGNLLTEAQQWEKVKLVRRIAQKVWNVK